MLWKELSLRLHRLVCPRVHSTFTHDKCVALLVSVRAKDSTLLLSGL